MIDLNKLTKEDKITFEKISDDIRQGIPVSLIDGVLAIDYQEALKSRKKWWQFWKKDGVRLK